jgi:hypothetical protein
MVDTFSTQGWIYILFSIILTIICLILNVYIQGPGLYLIVYVIYIFVIMLTGYNITCLTKGECYIWSWIVSILSLIPMALLIAFLIYFIIYVKM